jgi:hypothetical protein
MRIKGSFKGSLDSHQGSPWQAKEKPLPCIPNPIPLYYNHLIPLQLFVQGIHRFCYLGLSQLFLLDPMESF